MLNLLTGQIEPNPTFYDGILYIVSVDTSDKDPEKWTAAAKHIILDAEYDQPISLDDIERDYPHVCKVIFEDVLKGCVYSYGNHTGDKGAEKWELTGTTVGYA